MDTDKYKGIVLHTIPYSDTRNIVKIYTPGGTNAYMVMRSKKQRNDALRPMTLVNFCSSKRENGNFAFLRDVEYVNSAMGVHYQLPKAAVSMFLNEVLYRLLADAGGDECMFSFVYKAVDVFCERDFVPDFHLRFLVHNAMKTGVSPVDNYHSDWVFDEQSAHFYRSENASCLQQQTAYWLHQLMTQDLYPCCQEQVVPKDVRNALLDCLLNYYTLHIADLSGIKSLEILKSLLHD
ncbi:MAG: recombination protein O N-terminal domain-containing protein [Bacteroidales bacterium]|nr:recombination protein O N-terminal domain-containing protein [Bacteroidales bacterium]